MTQLAINYVINPFNHIYQSIKHGMELVGYARAAGELRRLGYEKEAQKLYDKMRELR